MIYKIAICDDDDLNKEIIKSTFVKVFLDFRIEVRPYLFDSYESLYLSIEEEQFNLIILNLDLGKDSNEGIEFAKKVSTTYNKIKKIYVSDDQEKLFDLLFTQPIGFFREQLLANDLKSQINSIVRMICNSKETSFLTVKYCNRFINIDLEKIVYIEGCLKNQFIYVEDGNYYTVRKTMSQLEDALKDVSFLRVHNSFIVNPKYIKSFDGHSFIYMFNNTGATIKIPVSRPKIKTVSSLSFQKSSII